MKELSIKQKAQRYDEALERAKGAHNSAKSDKENGVTDKITEYTVQLTETIFPELKVNEDERIRKHLIGVVELYYGNTDEQEKKDCLAWLEKQGKNTTNNEPHLLTHERAMEISPFMRSGFENKDKVEPKFKVGDIVKHKKNPHLTYILKRFTDDGDYEFHAIGKDGHEGETCFAVVKYQDNWELVEQKSVDKVEPKFKIGDVIVEIKPNGYGRPVRVKYVDVGEGSYYCKSDDEKRFLSFPIISQDEYKLVKQVSVWSEEDESKIVKLKSLIAQCNGFNKENRNKAFELIDSIKPRHTWKPSKEQMEYLHKYAEQNNYDGAILASLYSDLKQLKQL